MSDTTTGEALGALFQSSEVLNWEEAHRRIHEERQRRQREEAHDRRRQEQLLVERVLQPSDQLRLSGFQGHPEPKWIIQEPRMAHERLWHSAVALDHHRILIVGGNDADRNDLGSTEVFDMTSMEWHQDWPELNRPRSYHATVLCQDKVYVHGGHDGNQALDSIEYLDLTSTFPQWTLLQNARLSRPRAGCAAVVLGDLIYIVGGWNGTTRQACVDIVDTTTGTLREGPPMLTPRAGCAAGVIHNTIYVVGGEDLEGNKLDTMEALSTERGVWQMGPSPMSTARSCAAMTVVAHCLVVMGGDSEEAYLSSAEVYDTKRGVWWTLPEMNEVRYGAAAVTLGESRVVVVGGSRGVSAHDTMEWINLKLALERLGKEQESQERGEAQPPPKTYSSKARNAANSNEFTTTFPCGPPTIIETPIVLPSHDPSETYFFETNEVPPKYKGGGSKRWRLLVCLALLVLWVVVTGVVVVWALANKQDENSSSANGVAPTPAPSLRQPTRPALPKPPVVEEEPPLNLERLIDFFSELSPETAQDLTDQTSPQYRAMVWLATDVKQNSWTFQDPRLKQRGLLAISYHSLRGDQWSAATGWLSTSLEECTWFGVACVDNETDIMSLILPENGLGGEIPRELGFLQSLHVVSFFGNAIEGTIPTTLGQLSLLKYLLLDANALTGSLPSTIGLLTNLESFEVSYNALSGSLPDVFASLTLLESLRLDLNVFNGPLPPSIQSLTSLKRLLLNDNEFTGSIPTGIGLCTELEELYVHSNNFFGVLPTELGLLQKLESLVMANNTLEGPIPETLGLAQSLRAISLSNNTMTGTIPTTLGLLPKIQFIQLSRNHFVGQMPLEVCSRDLAFGVEDAVTADCEGPKPEVTCLCCTNCP